VSSSVEVLRQFEILQDLSADELAVIARHLTAVRFARGTYVLREGEPGDSLYFLYEGTLVAEKLVDGATGTRKDLAIIPAHAFVGEMALVDQEPRSAGVRAEVSSQALKLGRADFDRIVDEHPTLAYKLFRAFYLELSRRLRSTNEELIMVYDIGKLLTTTTDRANLGRAVMKKLLARLGASFAFVAAVEGTDLRITAVAGEGSDKLNGLRIPLDQGLVASAFVSKKPVLVERLLGELESWEGTSMIIAPIVVSDEAMGALVVGTAQGEACPWKVSDLSLAAAVANLAAGALIGK